jgi:hypothetical protein
MAYLKLELELVNMVSKILIFDNIPIPHSYNHLEHNLAETHHNQGHIFDNLFSPSYLTTLVTSNHSFIFNNFHKCHNNTHNVFH